MADFRSQFLELYYGRYLRPAKDYVVGSLELMLPYVGGVPGRLTTGPWQPSDCKR